MNLLNVNIIKCGVSIPLSANVQANTVFDHNIECVASLELVFEKSFFPYAGSIGVIMIFDLQRVFLIIKNINKIIMGIDFR